MGVASLFRGLRDEVEKASGWRIRAEFPFGNEKYRDLRRVLPQLDIRTVLDVGANTGQSAVQYRKEFPDAVMHCFEPVGSTADQLRKYIHHPSVHIHQLALGACPGMLTMQISLDEQQSGMNSLKGIHPHLEGSNFRSEQVEVTTLDEWCPKNGIGQVDLLKIDTEGFDLEVLHGASGLLDQGRIGLIDVEMGINPTNTFHAPFTEISPFLWSKGMLFFGIYDQLQELPTTGPILRRVNGLFISSQLALPAATKP